MENSRWATSAPEPAESLPAISLTKVIRQTPNGSESNQAQTTEAPLEYQPKALNPFSAPFQPGVQYDGAMDDFSQTRPPDDLFEDELEPYEEAVVEAAPVPVQQAPTGPKASRRASRPDGKGAQQSTNTDEAQTPGPEGKQFEPVRGDRSGTGGVKKAKLTEEELSQRMEAIRLKNAALEAAHAKAEADVASYQAREAEEAVKRKLERQNRQQMEGEREKNRQRKMKAFGGREWDAEKAEEQEDLGRGSRFRRGAHGGVARSSGRGGARDAQPERTPEMQATEAWALQQGQEWKPEEAAWEPASQGNAWEPAPVGEAWGGDRKPIEDDLSQYMWDDKPRGGFSGRGRGRGGGGDRGRGGGRGRGGERGRGGGRGRGRGDIDFSGHQHNARPPRQDVPNASDFPSLPVASPPPRDSDTPRRLKMAIKSPQPANADNSWANTGAQADSSWGEPSTQADSSWTPAEPPKQAESTWADEMDAPAAPVPDANW